MVLGSIVALRLIVGDADADGAELAKKIQANTDLACIESWATDISKTTPRVNGTKDIYESRWPECVRSVRIDKAHALHVTRVILYEDGAVTLFVGATWRLRVAGPPVDTRPGQWPVGKNSSLAGVER